MLDLAKLAAWKKNRHRKRLDLAKFAARTIFLGTGKG